MASGAACSIAPARSNCGGAGLGGGDGGRTTTAVGDGVGAAVGDLATDGMGVEIGVALGAGVALAPASTCATCFVGSEGCLTRRKIATSPTAIMRAPMIRLFPKGRPGGVGPAPVLCGAGMRSIPVGAEGADGAAGGGGGGAIKCGAGVPQSGHCGCFAGSYTRPQAQRIRFGLIVDWVRHLAIQNYCSGQVRPGHQKENLARGFGLAVAAPLPSSVSLAPSA